MDAAAASAPEDASAAAGRPAGVPCVTCGGLQRQRLSAGACHDVLGHVRSADCFELFGLTPGFNLDAALLTRRYLAICRNVHPDAYASAERGVQEAALGIAAAVNRAYDILREPARRAEYLLAIAGGPSAQEDRAVPDGLLPEVMMLREEMEEALAGSDRQTLADLRSRAAARKQAIDGRIGDLAGRLGDGPAARGELRRQLNALKYWDNLLADLSAAALRSPEQGP